MAVRFGPFSLDASGRQIVHGRTPLHLTPKAFDLIAFLVAQAPRVVSKRELHDLLWPGTFVSDASLTGLVKEIRRVLKDEELDVPVIRTVHRVGYACGMDVSPVAQGGRTSYWLVLQGRRVMLRQGNNIVGRDPASDVCLETPGVSRRHACIAIDHEGVRLEDLGSKNGTTVGGSKLRSAVALRDGDRIAFGSVVTVFRASGEGMSTETHSNVGFSRVSP
jgi:DNA-binding winged helix-turn-helix (wHTH) protein